MNIKWSTIKTFKDIKYEKGQKESQGINKITINRPEVRNAFRPKTVFEIMFAKGGDPTHISKNMDLVQVSDKEFIADTVSKVIDENRPAVEDYINGKDSALKFMVGQVMKNTNGKANPKLAQEKLKQTLQNMT